MNVKTIAGLGSLVLGLSLSPAAFAQQAAAPPPDAQPPQDPAEAQAEPPPPGQADEPTPAAAPAPPPAQVAPAPAAAPPPSWVYSYPTGQWVYTAGRGWIWVPAASTATVVEGVPYAYLYTPALGWTWYVSPWGWGPYRFGAWAAHPWHPVGWRGGWAAHPRVAARLGRAHFRR